MNGYETALVTGASSDIGAAVACAPAASGPTPTGEVPGGILHDGDER